MAAGLINEGNWAKMAMCWCCNWWTLLGNQPAPDLDMMLSTRCIINTCMLDPRSKMIACSGAGPGQKCINNKRLTNRRRPPHLLPRYILTPIRILGSRLCVRSVPYPLSQFPAAQEGARGQNINIIHRWAHAAPLNASRPARL